MSLEELADKLRAMWEAAPEGARSPMVHLFGIKYADDLEGMNLQDIAELAGRPRSMGTEIYKGCRLAQYVTEKQAAREKHRTVHPLQKNVVNFEASLMNSSKAQETS